MIFENEAELKERVEELTGRKMPGPPQIVEDTTEYMSIAGGMILRLEEHDYFVTGDATEGRFGIEEQPKFWVKYVVDLETGEKKIVKLVFHEDFTSRIGPFLIRGSRSPHKEAGVLEVARGHPNFMQGRPITDPAGNLVRIIDYVRGPNLFRYLHDLPLDHETYFHTVFPTVMEKLLEAFGAIDFLTRNDQHHGDARSDHIIIEKESKRYVWIDFDFEVSHSDFDIISLGAVLVFAVGKGRHNFQDVIQCPDEYPVKFDDAGLSSDDAMLLHKSMITNLKKLFPYIPEKLNRVMLSFSAGTSFFYESVRALIDDLKEAYPPDSGKG